MLTAQLLTEARSRQPPKHSLVKEQCGGTAFSLRKDAQLTVATAYARHWAGKAQVVEC